MLQRDHWESKRILSRRRPEHPVIEAFSMPKVNKIITNIDPKSSNGMTNGSLLDIGSGNGYFSYYLNQYFEVTCLDYSHTILSICPLKKRVQASASALPYPNNAFNVAFCANLLHHVDIPIDVVNEMYRVSSRFVVLIEPNRNNPIMLLISLISKNDRKLRRFNSKYLENLVKQKMKIVLITSMGAVLPNITPIYLLPIIRKIEPYIFPKLYNIVIAEKNAN
jgi:ubiquinone/menaquinone biosynthesis C-methylase UbiE